MFEPARMLHIQLRALLENEIQLVTKELTTYVYDTLYEKVFPVEPDDTDENENSNEDNGE